MAKNEDIVTKKELINTAAKKAGTTQTDMATAYQALMDTLEEALQDGRKVTLVGFGTFEVKDVPAKEAINPATGEKVSVPASKKPVLKFGKSFKDSFNA